VEIFSPGSEEELAHVVAGARVPFVVEGSGSKCGLGQPMAELPVLSLASFNTVKLYEPEELVLEAGAGTPLDQIEALLATANQRLAFEPPDFSRLLQSNQRGTLGGMVACALSGPRRLTAGAVRDHVLGVRGVNGRGEIFKAGGRVVKNVTGYDISKLVTGSFGTLAALTSITLKVLPKSETEVTLLAKTDDAKAAGVLMRAAMQSPHDVSSAAFVPGNGVALRVEGIEVSVTSRLQSLVNHLGGDFEQIPEVQSQRLWRGIRDLDHFQLAEERALWRISVAPTDGPGLAELLAAKFEGRFSLDWAGGLIWLDVPAGEDGHAAAIRAEVGSGHAVLMTASDDVRQRARVFHPQPSALALLTRKVKQAFDPKGLFNPHRMSLEY
jgi:glycolate oxidase FAD binding subunit